MSLILSYGAVHMRLADGPLPRIPALFAICALVVIGIAMLRCQPVAAAPASPSAPAIAACPGDCDGSGQVTVDEIVTLVTIALGDAPLDDCLNGDTNQDGAITVDEVLAAVTNALNGCLPQLEITEFVIPSNASFPLEYVAGLTAGPDGNLWFTQFTTGTPGNVGRITPDGAVMLFPADEGMTGITTGPDNNLWFGQSIQQMVNNQVTFVGEIGRMTSDGTLTRFPLSSEMGVPSIANGPDGNLWFTELSYSSALVKPTTKGAIGRITPAGEITEFPLPTEEGAGAITSGADGNVWFTTLTLHPTPAFGGILLSSSVGRVKPAGTITLFALPATLTLLGGITAGPDGNVWFAETTFDASLQIAGGRVGWATPAGTLTEIPVALTEPPAGAPPNSIAAGPDGNLWVVGTFIDFGLGGQMTISGSIARITPGGAVTAFAVPPNVGPGSITAGPDGNLWFMDVTSKIGRITFVAQ